jgi:penicillin-binding protein 1C
VHLSLDGRYRIIDRSEPTITKNVFTLPPSMEHYYKKIHLEYMSLPPVKANPHQANFHDSPMKFLYPSEGSIIKIPRKLDGSEGKLTCSIAHSDPDVELFWHCDDVFIGVTSDIHSISIPLRSGNYNLYVTDSNGYAIFNHICVL